MNKQREDLFDDIKRKSLSLFGVSYQRLALLITIVVTLGIYLGFLLFGENSLEQYLKLQDEKSYYQQLVIDLKEHNAKLQKDYFELKEVQPRQ